MRLQRCIERPSPDQGSVPHGLFGLAGRYAFVRGANTGIGQGFWIVLGAAGAGVVLVRRTSAKDAVHAMRASGMRSAVIAADLSTALPVQEMVDAIFPELQCPDILVHDARIIRQTNALEFSEED